MLKLNNILNLKNEKALKVAKVLSFKLAGANEDYTIELGLWFRKDDEALNTYLLNINYKVYGYGYPFSYIPKDLNKDVITIELKSSKDLTLEEALEKIINYDIKGVNTLITNALNMEVALAQVELFNKHNKKMEEERA